MPLGFLAVLTHPSSQLPLQDFHAWYEDEHIPIRMNRLQEFLSGARYVAADGDVVGTGLQGLVGGEGEGEGEGEGCGGGTGTRKETEKGTEKGIGKETGKETGKGISKLPIAKPDWLAMYEIDDTETFSKPVYTDLRKMRSERETDVMRRIEVVERRVGRIAWDSDSDSVGNVGEALRGGAELTSESESESELAGKRSRTGLRVGNPCQWLVTVSVNVEPYDRFIGDEEVGEWVAEFVKSRLGGVGVDRVRVIDVFEWGCTSMGPALTGVVGPRWFLVIECSSEDSAKRLVAEQVTKGRDVSLSGLSLVDWRLWNLWKAYPSLASSS